MINASDVGKLLYERDLLILQGNEIAAERIQILIDKLLKEKKILDEPEEDK